MCNMADKKTLVEVTPTSSAEIDAIVVRIAIEDEQKLPHLAKELQFNSSQQKESIEGTDQSVLQTSLGQRCMQEIRLERYTSHGSVTSSITSDDLPLKELPDKIPYFSGIPSVDVVHGIIHLFRDRSKTIDGRTSEVLCILGIPAHLSLSDLLNFLSPALSVILTLQVVRDSTPNQYMVLLKFKDKLSAKEFYASYNLRRYSSLEKRVCQLVYASRIEIVKTSQDSLPNSGLTELPSCPVCLERLDESVLTILCNHSFHTYCLTKWEDSTCPVCRYTQIPEPTGENTCNTCDSKEDLWICLICGHVGCGRYHGGHAHEHFSITQHTFSMHLSSQRVWDYIGDNYVHRLVQNKGDGKLVEVSGLITEISDDEKIDSLQLEYTYLLTSQLESQRLFFEEKLGRVEEEYRDQIAALESRCRSTVSEKEMLEVKLIEQERERKEKDRKLQQVQTKLLKVQNELQEEKQLNKCMSENQQVFRERITILEEKMESSLEKKNKEIQELQDQVKDLMFSLEIQQKIAEAPEETRQDIQSGHLVVTQSSEGASTSVKKSGRKKGKHL